MLVPVISDIRTEDFPAEQQKWIPKLLLPLNNFIRSVVTALNGNITLSDNIPCQLIKLQFTYNAATDFPKQVKWSVGLNAQGSTTVVPLELMVCSATEDGTAVSIINPPWSYANGLISIPYLFKVTSAGVVSSLNVGSVYNIILRGQP